MVATEPVREQVLALLAALELVAARRGVMRAAALLHSAARRLRLDHPLVVVWGAPKAGKSSVATALLGEEPPVCPVDAVLPTSAVTVVGCGVTEQVTAGCLGGADVATQQIERSEIADYATEVRDPDLIGLVAVRTPARPLGRATVLVDLPGGLPDRPRPDAAVAAFLAAADVLLVVVDCGRPPSGAELAGLAPFCRAAGALVVVLNKADTVHPEHADRMREAVSAALPSAAVVSVSSRAERAHLAGGGAGRLPEGGFAALASAVEAGLERRSGALMRGALADLEAGLAMLQTRDVHLPADATWKARFRTRMRRIGRDLLLDLDGGIAAAPNGPRGGLLVGEATLDGAMRARAGELAAQARAAVAVELGLTAAGPAPVPVRPRRAQADPVAAAIGIGIAGLAAAAPAGAPPGARLRLALAELVERLAREYLVELAALVAARSEALAAAATPDAAADLEVVGEVAAAVPALAARPGTGPGLLGPAHPGTSVIWSR